MTTPNILTGPETGPPNPVPAPGPPAHLPPPSPPVHLPPPPKPGLQTLGSGPPTHAQLGALTHQAEQVQTPLYRVGVSTPGAPPIETTNMQEVMNAVQAYLSQHAASPPASAGSMPPPMTITIGATHHRGAPGPPSRL